MGMIRDILMYLDRDYISTTKYTPVYNLGHAVYKEIILYDDKIGPRLRDSLLSSIKLEREGRAANKVVMRNVIAMLVELSIPAANSTLYTDFFELEFLQQTREFYSREAEMYLNYSVPEFLEKAETRMLEERQRVDDYLHHSTLSSLEALMDDVWIKPHYTALGKSPTSGMAALYYDDKINDVWRMYRLFCRLPAAVAEMKTALKDSIIALGEDIRKDSSIVNQPLEVIERILALKAKYDRFHMLSFYGCQDVATCIKTAFETFINKDIRVPQFLSMYIDDMLKKSIKGLSEAAAEQRMDQAIVIFRYISDKDVFESYYKQHLAKRLLQRRSLSEEHERSMISKLKSECGYQYAAKMEGMFKDLGTSEHIMREYSPALSNRDRLNVRLEAKVLTTGIWPCSEPADVLPPPELQPILKHFETFYLSMHTGRRIKWNLSLGGAEVRANLPKGVHDLAVSTYQLIILYQFNRQDSYSFMELLELTRIPAADLRRHLITLFATPKSRILRRTKIFDPKTITDHDTFQVNTNFESRMVRIMVPLVVEGSGTPAGDTVSTNTLPPNLEQDRQRLIEACIVRIMKARKTLNHNELLLEVSRHSSLRFDPSVSMIKTLIEKLIDREYMQRDSTDR
eukprot:GHVT01070551.1.p1 GENE.GHVT01070551.1~~GHVT01070551.1.p1  ORF type:complete len:627 (-),score=20.04 GHVT01070551.1:112-1992(-)